MTDKALSTLIADFVTGLDAGAIPDAAITHARRAFIDTTGVMLVGSKEHHAGIARKMAREEGATPVAGVAGTSMRTSAQFAALANGVAAHGIDYDFSYLMGQPHASLIPALYPVAEKTGASSRELLAAFVIGFEIVSRLARAMPQHSMVGGWHATGSIGTIATSVAVARLMKVPAAAIPDVIGIAVAMASSMPVNFGTMTKPLHAGHAARNAVTAATLGMNGYTASPVALEGRMGYFNAFARGQDIHPEVFDDLGRNYDLAQFAFSVKGYPCGGLAHTAIDATLEIREELGARIADIAEVKVGITRFASRNIKTVYPHSAEASKFSAPFVAAYTLIHGAPMIDAFTEKAIADEKVKALAAKVTGYVDESFGNPVEIPLPSRVTVTLNDGKVIERVRDFAIGTPARPMTDAQLKAKFMDCATRTISKDTAEQLHASLSKLGETPSLGGLWPLLYPKN